jgi:hypothetical protein
MRRTPSGRASYGEVVAGMGASVADDVAGGFDEAAVVAGCAAVVAGGAAFCSPEQAVAAATISRATPLRQTPD